MSVARAVIVIEFVVFSLNVIVCTTGAVFIIVLHVVVFDICEFSALSFTVTLILYSPSTKFVNV